MRNTREGHPTVSDDIPDPNVSIASGGSDVPLASPQIPLLSPRPRTTLLPALRHRNFRLFYGGFVVSLIGVWMQRVAQSWLVLDLTDSAFWVGLIDALGSLPVLLFTLYAGVLADRVPRRPMVMITQTGAMTAALALAALTLTGVVQLWHIVVLAALLGTANAFDIPARHALMVDMVGKDDLTNAVALNSSAFNGTRIVGPAIAGVLIAAAGVGICFLLNGLSYLAVIAALAAVRVSASSRDDRPADSGWHRLTDGFRHVTTEHRTRLLIVNTAAISVFGLPALVLLPVVARDVLGRGAREYGWLMSAMGVGALGGALAIAVLGHRLPRGRIVGWSATAFGATVTLFGFSRSLSVSLALLTVLGSAMIVTTALTNTLVQTLAPDELRARSVAFYAWAFVGLSPLGAVQAGAVAEWLGAGTAIALGGVMTTIVAAGTLLRSREVRETR